MSVIKPAIQFPVLIAYLEGANNYTWLHFRDGKKRLLSKSLSYLEEQPELGTFIRIHKTVLINPVCVAQLLAPPRPKMAGAMQVEGGVVLPVSRRRWSQVAALLSNKLMATPNLRPRLITITHPPAPATPSAPPRSIVFVTDNALSALLVQQVADQYWQHCIVHVRSEAMPLSATLGQVPPDKLPVFVLLDARTARQERLNALQHLKQDSRLGWLPVVLLVAPTDEAVQAGYHRQASSVITVGQEHTQFIQMIRSLGQFWLETAALPSKPDVIR